MNEDTGREQRMVEEFMAGTDVPAIAARYAVPDAYVDRVIEEASFAKPKSGGGRWSMNDWENRLGYSIAAGVLVGLVTRVPVFGTVVAVVLFVITTAIVTTKRR